MDAFYDVVSDEKLLEWEVCLQRLTADNNEVRVEAAAKLRQCVERALRELSTDSFEKFESEVHQRVFNLLNEKVGLCVALRCVGDFDCFATELVQHSTEDTAINIVAAGAVVAASRHTACFAATSSISFLGHDPELEAVVSRDARTYDIHGARK